MFRPCIIIPVFNHAKPLQQTVADIAALELPCLLVDDGSDQECKAVLQTLEKKYAWLSLETLAENSGKGAAVQQGLRKAFELGYSHGLQVDADGQHNTSDIPHFFQLAKDNPESIINGCPRYDESVPSHRKYARYITHVWVWINTLSLHIKDSMCGFRVYPLASTVNLINDSYIGKRMDFDTEIIVKSYWRKIPIINIDTEVHYPEDGASHFRPLRDNVRITLMHTRLFFGMLIRIPSLLLRKLA